MGDKERLCAMEPCFELKRYTLQARLETRTTKSAGQRSTYWVTGAHVRSLTLLHPERPFGHSGCNRVKLIVVPPAKNCKSPVALVWLFLRHLQPKFRSPAEKPNTDVLINTASTVIY